MQIIIAVIGRYDASHVHTTEEVEFERFNITNTRSYIVVGHLS